MTAPAADRAAIREKWLGWVGTIENELYLAHMHQSMWAEVRKTILRRSPTRDGTWLWSYSQLYAATCSLAVRRLAEVDEQTASLGSLVEAIRRNREVVTLDWHRDKARADRTEAGEDFDEDLYTRLTGPALFGADGLIPEANLNRDLDRLAAAAASVKQYVDGRLAHMDKRYVEAEARALLTLTFAEIRTALGDVADIAGRYVALLRGPAIGAWTPAILTDWTKPLEEFGFDDIPASP